jgi:RimJ/RimL family protein N-acetyltransferase
MIVQPVVLEGQNVRLEPLSLGHLSRLAEIGLQGDIFRSFTEPVRTQAGMRKFIMTALEEQAAGKSLPFATFDKQSGLGVGSTRFMNIEPAHLRVEIGGTWIAPEWQRTAINTEAKYLMMRYAFETWGCNRVELKTDTLNQQSRRAIARIGAKEEGIFRNHMVTASGRLRHSVYYSVIRKEWPQVKAALEAKMEKRRATARGGD